MEQLGTATSAVCTQAACGPRGRGHRVLFFSIAIGLVACAVVRSAIATRLNDFDQDTPWHIAAGVSYVRLRDFRVNPEHPPLVKLWVGASFAGSQFKLAALRRFEDKGDEREFTADQIFLNNDPDWVQRRARLSMFALNALLLLGFAWAVRRTFNDDLLPLCVLAFLVIDPTVSAHMPVVLTDLPVALLSSTAVLCAVVAFRTWRKVDLLLASCSLGLALATKHSAPVTAIAVAIIGVTLSLMTPSERRRERPRHFAQVALVTVGAVLVLWGFYLFRFRESPTPGEHFNRPLAAKISDLQSPLYHTVLSSIAAGHLLPRAYLWGFADTIRAGIEGRAEAVYAFGRLYYGKGPIYFFPGILAVKLPIGLIALVAIGLILVIKRKLPRSWSTPISCLLGFAVLFLLVLASGSTYGGVRHALPLFPVLAICAALPLHHAITTRSLVFRSAVSLALASALLSAIPVIRPWEYYNELIGGSSNAYRYFLDEGLDGLATMRGLELVSYYHEQLEPRGIVPYILQGMPYQERRRRRIHWVGEDPARDRAQLEGDVWSGTIFAGPISFAPKQWWDRSWFRSTPPVARFGNLFVFRGTFPARTLKAPRLYFAAKDYIYTAKPDLQAARKLLAESVSLDPTAFFVAIELGNVEARLGDRDGALAAYETARKYAPARQEAEAIATQIARISTEPLEIVPPLRNPELE